MPYLIDGHNLIAYLHDLDLADPDDEAKLVLKLRGFCVRHRKKCVVIFDHGLPGGRSAMSTPSVRVIFASSQQTTADKIIHERIRETKDVNGWIVVTSDNEIIAEAERYRMRGMRSAQFAELLINEKPEYDLGEHPNVRVSIEEVDEWLQIFGEDDVIINEAPPETPITPAPQKPKQQIVTPPPAKPNPVAKSPKPPKVSLQQSVDADPYIPNTDVDDWLNVFGEEDNQRKPTDKARKPTIKPAEPENKEESATPKKLAKPSADMRKKAGDEHLGDNTVDAWLQEFGEQDPTREATDPAFQRSDPSKQGRYKNSKGKREPVVHKRMATSTDIHLNAGEVEAWMDVFGVDDNGKKKK